MNIKNKILWQADFEISEIMISVEMGHVMNIKEFYSQFGDYDNVIERFGGNEKMLSKFVKRFPTDKSYECLALAYEHNDDINVYQYAVTFGEVCGSLALTEMGKMVRIIADAYRTGEAAARKLF